MKMTRTGHKRKMSVKAKTAPAKKSVKARVGKVKKSPKAKVSGKTRKMGY